MDEQDLVRTGESIFRRGTAPPAKLCAPTLTDSEIKSLFILLATHRLTSFRKGTKGEGGSTLEAPSPASQVQPIRGPNFSFTSPGHGDLVAASETLYTGTFPPFLPQGVPALCYEAYLLHIAGLHSKSLLATPVGSTKVRVLFLASLVDPPFPSSKFNSFGLESCCLPHRG